MKNELPHENRSVEKLKDELNDKTLKELSDGQTDLLTLELHTRMKVDGPGLKLLCREELEWVIQQYIDDEYFLLEGSENTFLEIVRSFVRSNYRALRPMPEDNEETIRWLRNQGWTPDDDSGV